MGNSWHKCCELIKSKDQGFPHKTWENAPVFLMDDSITEDKEKYDSTLSSFNEMIKADLYPMPFEKFIVQEKMVGENEKYGVSNFYLFKKTSIQLEDTRENIDGTEISSVSYATLNGREVCSVVFINLFIGRPYFQDGSDEIRLKTGKPSFLDPSIKNFTLVVDPVRRILSELLVVTSTKGIEQIKEIAPQKLNAKRIRNGKTPISDTIYIRASYYYDANGKQHFIDPNRTVKLHWRRGHIRGVRYGAGRTELKKVYIQPCLVNFREGDEAPEHKTRVICA